MARSRAQTLHPDIAPVEVELTAFRKKDTVIFELYITSTSAEYSRVYLSSLMDVLPNVAEPLKEIALQPTTKIPIEIKKKTHYLLPGKPHTISTRMLFVI